MMHAGACCIRSTRRSRRICHDSPHRTHADFEQTPRRGKLLPARWGRAGSSAGAPGSGGPRRVLCRSTTADSLSHADSVRQNRRDLVGAGSVISNQARARVVRAPTQRLGRVPCLFRRSEPSKGRTAPAEGLARQLLPSLWHAPKGGCCSAGRVWPWWVKDRGAREPTGLRGQVV